MEPYIGEIRLLPYTFAPSGWHDCDGSLLPISANQALFSLIGTTYGGNGTSTFALPDLRGRLPVHMGGDFTIGEIAGTETVTLLSSQMPMHSHPLHATNVNANATAPGNTVELGAISNDTMYTNDIQGLPPELFLPTTVGAAGGTTPHENCMPTLAVRFCICMAGVFPSRP